MLVIHTRYFHDFSIIKVIASCPGVSSNSLIFLIHIYGSFHICIQSSIIHFSLSIYNPRALLSSINNAHDTSGVL